MTNETTSPVEGTQADCGLGRPLMVRDPVYHLGRPDWGLGVVQSIGDTGSVSVCWWGGPNGYMQVGTRPENLIHYVARHRIASRATDNALAEATKIIRHLVGDWDGYPDSEMLELVTRDDSIIPDDHDEPLGDPGVTVGQLRRILAALEGEG